MKKRLFPFVALLFIALLLSYLNFRLSVEEIASPGPFAKSQVAHSKDKAKEGSLFSQNSGRAKASLAEAPLAYAYESPTTAELTFEGRIKAPSRDVRYVRLDQALLNGKKSPLWQRAGEGRMRFPLPEGGEWVVRIEGSRMLDSKRFSSWGGVEGQPGSRVLISGAGEGQYSIALYGSAMEEGRVVPKTYALRPTGTELTQFYEVDSQMLPPCGGAKEVPTEIGQPPVASAGIEGEWLEAAEAAEDSTALVSNIDVMILYTSDLRKAVQGTSSLTTALAAIQATADHAVLDANDSYNRSKVKAQLRLVKLAEVNHSENSSTSTSVNDDALQAMFSKTDGKMDEIHALREEVGADLVCLMVYRYDNTSIGLGYILKPAKVVDTRDSRFNDQAGFCVVTYDYVQSTSVFAHEIGHNLGCAHDRENAKNSAGEVVPGAFPYAFGYKFDGSSGKSYGTIMSYSNNRVRYFSNPEVVASESFLGVPVGVAVGQSGEANNALCISKTAFEVAAFRLQKQSPANTGRLLAVSTRAWVGPGQEEMVAGLIMEGTQPKRVLIRAAGDSLQKFGLTQTLADPVIEFNRTQPNPEKLVVNDDWGTQSSATGLAPGTATEIQSTAAAVDLFPFDNARESGLLLTLDPTHWYTANVQTKTGSGGNAIVEAYEVDRSSAPKMIALSTRAYAAKGKDIVAGFTVNSAAGQTKRIIIRAQGPSLSQYGITNAMYDPILYLHGQDGTMLLSNDDWVATTTNRDDTKPKAVYYDELAIVATGKAPQNRREPAILVDLPAGVYTAILRPFELISTDPNEAQESIPGITIVEVFEVN